MFKFPCFFRPRRLRLAVEIGCALGFALTVVLSVAAQQYRELCREVCRDTLRLHVLANSDALSDQIQKLAVRDAILEAVSAATADATDKAEAVAAVRAALPGLELLDAPLMIAEDFAFYQRALPGVFLLLGTGDTPPLHADTFDFDESVLEAGFGAWRALVRMP